MSNDFSESIQIVVDGLKINLVNDLATCIKTELESQVKAADITKDIDIQGLVRRAIQDDFNRVVATEIGNRLRCGIYEGTSVTKLFESTWTSEFDKAIQDRIRSRVDKAIDVAIAERLKNLRG